MKLLHILGLTLVGTLLLGHPLRASNQMSAAESQRARLAALVATHPEAAKLFSKYQRQADAALTDAPHPVREIVTAGKLASDPAKIESRAALEDMGKLAAFGYAYAITTNTAYATAAKRMILAWAQVNQPTGRPIDETKLEPLFVAYGLTADAFSPAETETVAAWLRLVARQEQAQVRPESDTSFNNWNSHRLKIIGLIGCVLDDSNLVASATSGFKTQITRNLRPDGSSFDFHERDALHYHCYDLEPLLTLAIALDSRTPGLYDWQSPAGASLRHAVRFLVPYCNGSAAHDEWVHSKVAFDRKRAEAGEAKFEIGSKFNPQDGLHALELAAFFEPELKPLVAQLATAASTNYPTWQCVLNDATRP